MAPGAFERVLKDDYMAPKEPTEVEKWMQKAGTKFVVIWFFDKRRGTFIDENHVDDDDTLLETITMTFDRLKLRSAIWSTPEGWTSLDRRTGEAKSWPHRSAAEMYVRMTDV